MQIAGAIAALRNILFPVTIVANSASSALTVTQDGAGNAATFNDVSSDTTPTVIDASGIIIAGFTSAINTATDTGGVVAPKLEVAGTGGGPSSAAVYSYSPTANNSAVLILSRSKSATLSAQAIVSAGDVLGSVVFTGSDGVQFIRGAYIQALVEGATGVNDMPTRLGFFTTPDGSATPVEALRISSSNNVSIGAIDPGANALHVLTIQNGSAPTTSPAGGQLYVVAGALFYRGSAGTVTPLGLA